MSATKHSPLDRRRLDASPPLLVELVTVLLLFAALWWARGDIAAWVRSWQPQQPAKVATIRCDAPAPFESLIVYVTPEADGSMRVKCGPSVGGSYTEWRR